MPRKLIQSVRAPLFFHPYLAVAGVVNLYIAALVLHIYRLPSYLPVHPMLHLVTWAFGVSAASTLLISLCRFRFGWTHHFRFVGFLDVTSSLLCLVLTRCLRVPGPDDRLHAFGYAYAAFVFTKLALLTWYGFANVHHDHETRNRWYVFVVSLLIYAAISPWALIASWPTGDEPHYLLLSHSLVYDHDFDLANNYAHQDYLPYLPVPMSETHTVKSKTGQAMLWHDVGTSILLVPGYWGDQRFGAMLEMNVIAASIAVAIYMLS